MIIAGAKGWKSKSIMQAIEVNGTMVDVNKKAWFLGRHSATVNGRGIIEREINRKHNIII